jgi:hypothetical protein
MNPSEQFTSIPTSEFTFLIISQICSKSFSDGPRHAQTRQKLLTPLSFAIFAFSIMVLAGSRLYVSIPVL